jgi:hypothetical protein
MAFCHQLSVRFLDFVKFHLIGHHVNSLRHSINALFEQDFVIEENGLVETNVLRLYHDFSGRQ